MAFNGVNLSALLAVSFLYIEIHGLCLRPILDSVGLSIYIL
jgi:hypothetical protein